MGSALCTRPKTLSGDTSPTGRSRRVEPKDQCSEACGLEIGSVFFEPKASVTTESWTYVGDGNGGYRKVQTFTYSPGGGYDADDAGQCPLRVRLLAGLLAAALLLTAGAWQLQRRGGLKGLSLTSWTGRGEEGFDCEVDGVEGPTGWSQEHRSWCCKAQQVLCPSDCDTGSEEAARAWSSRKKAWCCQDQGVGCEPGMAPGPRPDGCKAVCTHDEESATCQDRLAWLARNRYRGQASACGRAADAVSQLCDVCRGCQPQGEECLAFDCEADLFHWQHTWPSDKQRWCCQKEGKGCAAPLDGEFEPRVKEGATEHAAVVTAATPSPTIPFHCGVGLSTWGWGWSDAKKDWCCKNQHIACPEEPEGPEG